MSEWSIEHAWKTTPANCIESHRNTSSRNRVNDFPPHNPSRCEPVNVGVYRWFRGDLTQFLHSSPIHLHRTSRCSYVRIDGSGQQLSRVRAGRLGIALVPRPPDLAKARTRPDRFVNTRCVSASPQHSIPQGPNVNTYARSPGPPEDSVST